MKTRKVLVMLAATAVIVLTACSSGSPAADTSSGTPTNPSAALPAETLTPDPGSKTASEGDLKNGTYLIDGQPITLVNGVAETEAAPGSTAKQVTRYFGNAINIDLNSDGTMDSAFLLRQESEGSGTFYFAAAALNTENGWLGTNAIFLGDRIAPQSTTLDPNNPSQFIVNYADRNAGESMSAQPTLGVSKTFKIENGSLVEVVASP